MAAILGMEKIVHCLIGLNENSTVSFTVSSLEFPSIFFELIQVPELNPDDYEFTSREVKQLAFRMDGLFLPKTSAGNKPFYLVEVQFQPDDDLYRRIF